MRNIVWLFTIKKDILFASFCIPGIFTGKDLLVPGILQVLKRKTRHKACLLICLLLFSGVVSAEVSLPRLIANNMVLQRDTELTLWGWASPGEGVQISLQGKTYTTRASREGDWQVVLPPQPAGGPHTMQINRRKLTGILFGDVWLCSGQSNMELPVRRVLALYDQEIRQADYPQIRQFKVPMRYRFESPERELEGGNWTEARGDDLLDFSAVAFFFVRNIHEKYQVPVGLINASVGGSPAEAWISEPALKPFPSYLRELSLCQTPDYVEACLKENREQLEAWDKELVQRDKAYKEPVHWASGDLLPEAWKSMDLPGYWADKGLPDWNGSFWFRKELILPDDMAGKEALLDLGCIVDADSVFVNGLFVGSTSYRYPPRRYPVPAGVLRTGLNRIVLRIVSHSGKGGVVEDKAFHLLFSDGKTYRLSGNWQYRVGATMTERPNQLFFQYKPTGLYNGMIAPLGTYAMKGVIWYQGESNTSRPEEYESLMTTLVGDWRKQWKNDRLPFLYVQLSSFMDAYNRPVESQWAALRQAQLMLSYHLPFTAMAVTHDVGEWNDIHPLNKKTVGDRLALQAARLAYGQTEVLSSGPMFERLEVSADSLILHFTQVGKGLSASGPIQQLAIAGEDGRFVWAEARISSPHTLTVWSKLVKRPKTVRYAWADNPYGANLYNSEGLPASPFTTDDYY